MSVFLIGDVGISVGFFTAMYLDNLRSFVTMYGFLPS
jgi:hypothetical protein